MSLTSPCTNGRKYSLKLSLILVLSIIISLVITFIGVGGTSFLFWFQRYDIPLSILTSGAIISLSWLALYLSKRGNTKRVKLDIALIYIRLILIVLIATVTTILEIKLAIVTISPVFLVVSYLVISLLTLLAYFKKGENDV